MIDIESEKNVSLLKPVNRGPVGEGAREERLLENRHHVIHASWKITQVIREVF